MVRPGRILVNIDQSTAQMRFNMSKSCRDKVMIHVLYLKPLEGTFVLKCPRLSFSNQIKLSAVLSLLRVDDASLIAFV